jgi:hypothetical protein
LEEDDIGGRRLVQLAIRVSAYGGVIAARLEEQSAKQNSQPPATAQHRTDVQHVEPVALGLTVPGVMSIGKA